ncbi:hypothetical protein MOX02_58090 [Methylobacterium oxalidis]|uniref:Uncharacterized protein n=1 Tax=Methylobacterium oxalidis TaxID=944322 RepID=A0A512JCW4_9HYPH|nr:hypothetical protein MOX02_58090 [Methylobacterium oxalidis]GLS66005.1 hypothetical protein GCM10007888_43870 [Methylobacterium oxalidis]
MDTATETDTLKAHVVTCQSPRIAGEEPVLKRWVVLTESAQAAAELVRERVAPACEIAATEEVLSQEEADRIGLKPHHPVAL